MRHCNCCQKTEPEVTFYTTNRKQIDCIDCTRRKLRERYQNSLTEPTRKNEYSDKIYEDIKNLERLAIQEAISLRGTSGKNKFIYPMFARTYQFFRAAYPPDKFR